MIALLFGLIMNFNCQAQDPIDFGNCQVLKIDSINYCTSHYSISFLTTVDTFTTVIEKSLVPPSIDSLIGTTVKISGEAMTTLVLSEKNRQLNISLVQSYESHPDTNVYGDICYTWRAKKSFWKKEFVSITLSELYLDNQKTSFKITKFEK